MRVTAAALATATVFAVGCDRDAAETQPTRPTGLRPPPATTPAAPSADDILAAHRPRVARALDADAACDAACSTPEALAQRAASFTRAVAPLDEELAASEAQDARRLRTATSPLLHASLELRTCLDLSADKHGGAARTNECAQPIRQLEQAAKALRQAIKAPD